MVISDLGVVVIATVFDVVVEVEVDGDTVVVGVFVVVVGFPNI